MSSNFNPDDPTGEIQVVTNLAMSYLERRGKQGDYEAIRAKVTAWMKELDAIADIGNATELLPCPFCGDEAQVERDGDFEDVVCLNTSCLVQPKALGLAARSARRTWNTRSANQ